MTRSSDLKAAISGKIVAYTLSGPYPLTTDDECQLWARYIHISANWNAGAGQGGSTLDVVFINAPDERERARHADIPGENTR